MKRKWFRPLVESSWILFDLGTLQNKQASKKTQNVLYFKKGIVRRGQKKSCNFMHGKHDPFYTLKAILFLKIQVFQIIWFIEVSGYCWPKSDSLACFFINLFAPSIWR